MGACVIQRCEEEPARGDDLCGGHAKEYRPGNEDLCPLCRRTKLKTEIEFTRGFCRMCRARKEKKRMAYAPMKPGTRDCQECGEDMAGEHCRAMRHKDCRKRKAARKKVAAKKPAPKKTSAQRAAEFEKRGVGEKATASRGEVGTETVAGDAGSSPAAPTPPEPELPIPLNAAGSEEPEASTSGGASPVNPDPELSLIERVEQLEECIGDTDVLSRDLVLQTLLERVEELEEGVPENILKLGRALKDLREELDELTLQVLGHRKGRKEKAG